MLSYVYVLKYIYDIFMHALYKMNTFENEHIYG